MPPSPAHTLHLTAPLGTDWTEQLTQLWLPDTPPGTPLALSLDGQPASFQYTGETRAADGAAAVLVRLGFATAATQHALCFTPAARATTDLRARSCPIGTRLRFGTDGHALSVPVPRSLREGLAGPFGAAGDFRFRSRIVCEAEFLGAELLRVNAGPLFTDYRLTYRFADDRWYVVTFRCFRAEPYVIVGERYALRMGASLDWTLNPDRNFDTILSRDSFEGERPPTCEPLGAEHPRDVLCRLQMPVLSEYFIPNNRGWFAFLDSRAPTRDMLGILGLYGDRWDQPVAGMPEILDRQGTVAWQASLASGARHWLLYRGPVDKGDAAESPSRFLFHRLHAEHNALRLGDHLDLAGRAIYDRDLDRQPGFFDTGDIHAAARARAVALTPLRRLLATEAGVKDTNLQALLNPTPATQAALFHRLEARFTLWVRQFQGWRTGQSDYAKNVIGFSRCLRGLLIGYELLRKDQALTPAQLGQLNAWFVFAARRIMDQGRWPHERTGLHPDHPQSTRDFYTYGGEHKPDRLYWTNCLPNFQSDPLCALAQLAALFPDHPDAADWLRLGLDDLEHQLDAYCGAGGAWEESINYAAYTLSYWVITFRVLKTRCGIDYFRDARVRRMLQWLVRFLGPRDRRWDRYTWPGVGNARCPTAGGDYLLCFAGELPVDDPLRSELTAAYLRLADNSLPTEHYPTVLAALAPIPDGTDSLPVLGSEAMDEVGVALRHRHQQPDESYLFQKIGFAKDHYEADETAFNWYAKGVPFAMDYGTYTGDVGIGAAHNLIDIPDLDPLRRGFLADRLFTDAVDYTRCEMPGTLKLLWGRVRTFAEIDGRDGVMDRTKTPYFYIGDRNPVGPKVWKGRLLLFVKPDYVVLLDRIHGDVPHRFCFHFTGSNLRRDDAAITGNGRFGVDLQAFVQHPAAADCDFETVTTVPNFQTPDDPQAGQAHAQDGFRLYNRTDGLYRTVLFAREPGRDVRLEALGPYGIRITTPEYTDCVWLHDAPVVTTSEGGFAFRGRAGWVRRMADGTRLACLADGDALTGFGLSFHGRGPWRYRDGDDGVTVLAGPPRRIEMAADASA